MTAEEIADFEALPHWQAAIRLRRSDEGAKVKIGKVGDDDDAPAAKGKGDD